MQQTKALQRGDALVQSVQASIRFREAIGDGDDTWRLGWWNPMGWDSSKDWKDNIWLFFLFAWEFGRRFRNLHREFMDDEDMRKSLAENYKSYHHILWCFFQTVCIIYACQCYSCSGDGVVPWMIDNCFELCILFWRWTTFYVRRGGLHSVITDPKPLMILFGDTHTDSFVLHTTEIHSA